MKNYKLYDWAISHYKCNGLEPKRCIWNRLMNLVIRVSGVNAFDTKG